MIKKWIGFCSLLLLILISTACGVTTTTFNQTSSSTSSASTSSSTTDTTLSTESTTDTTLTTEPAYVYDPISVPLNLFEEERLSFKFFWEVVNGNPDSSGYGMISDRYNTKNSTYGAASIASVGFGLAAIPIGIVNDWIGFQEGYDRVLGTLQTLQTMQRTHGFYYHFVSMSSATRSGLSEVSIIDTAILMCGAIMAGEYFGGEIKTIANELYQAVEWNWYFDTNRMMFYMGYMPENGFGGHWDMYAEQLMIYFLAAASDDYAVGKSAYDQMKNSSQIKRYGTGPNFYVSWPGTLFTYQYSHAFFDFRNATDSEGVNWFDNSSAATLAAQEFSGWLDNNYLAYNQNAWGNTASDCPDGYCASGNLPAAGTIYIDGTLAPSGAIGSIVFRPDLVLPAMEHYAQITALQSKYGLLDAYNLGLTATAASTVKRPNAVIPEGGWFSTDVIGIDKGITVLMVENYRSGFIWYYFMRSDIIQKGYAELGFTFTN
jgi:hypothetical protein